MRDFRLDDGLVRSLMCEIEEAQLVPIMCGIHLHLSRVVVQQEQQLHNSNGGTSRLVVDDGKEEVVPPASWLCRRGPDHQGFITFHNQQIKRTTTSTTNNNSDNTNNMVVKVKLSLQASVLNMREHLVHQPVSIPIPRMAVVCSSSSNNNNKMQHDTNTNNNDKNAADNAAMMIHLCWNGEVYQEQQQQAQEGGDETENGIEPMPTDEQQQIPQEQRQQRHDVWRFQESDTNLVALRLQEALNSLLSAKKQADPTPCDMDINTSQQEQQHDNGNNNNNNDIIFHAIYTTMSSLVDAEYAYCITTPECVYYGKDPWGCRSLLTGRRQRSCTSTNSKKDDDTITNNCNTNTDDAPTTTTLAASSMTDDADSSSSCYTWYLSSVASCCITEATTTPADVGCCVVRCNNNRNDSNIEWTEVPPGIVFEYNFMTDQTRSLPLQTSLMKPTAVATPARTNNNNNSNAVRTNSVDHDVSSNIRDDDKSHVDNNGIRRHDDNDDSFIIHPDNDDENDEIDELAPIRQLYVLLRQAVRRRMTGPCTVLFSGGLDSVVLAALALQQQQELLQQQEEQEEEHLAQHKEQQQQRQQSSGCRRDYSIALVNISFLDDDDDHDDENGTSSLPVVAADTRAALASYHELQQLYPNAKFEFIQRQVTYQQVAEQEEHIRKLIHPKQSTMDLNIATALWFAAQSTTSTSTLPIEQQHRILLTGLGADELMGGYGRHRKAFQRAGASALREELRMDQERLWERNLGRDDRVLSDHGKEARFPYLDCDVVQFLTSLASSSSTTTSLCDFSLPPGQGDKRILRLVARHFLHLEVASTAVKRAIQFGSRISHVCDKRRFGSRRKAKGETSALKIGTRVANETTPT